MQKTAAYNDDQSSTFIISVRIEKPKCLHHPAFI